MQLTISQDDAGKRLDQVAALKTGLTRSRVQGLINEGAITVNSKTVKPSLHLRLGDVFDFVMPIEVPGDILLAQDIPIEILYQDEYLVVVDKPASMVVYPAAGHRDGTLMNALAYRCPRMANVGAPLRPGVVHRLDKDTSGVMVVALEDNAYYNLVEQFRERAMMRYYYALVYGSMQNNKGEIDLGIGRSTSDRKRMSTMCKRKKEALTLWEVVGRYKGATLIKARLATGRTHQIRVHFASIGHPVLGDETYGNKLHIDIPGAGRVSFPRQMLHAAALGFVHPATGQYMEFTAQMPEDFTLAIKQLEGVNG